MAIFNSYVKLPDGTHIFVDFPFESPGFFFPRLTNFTRFKSLRAIGDIVASKLRRNISGSAGRSRSFWVLEKWYIHWITLVIRLDNTSNIMSYPRMWIWQLNMANHLNLSKSSKKIIFRNYVTSEQLHICIYVYSIWTYMKYFTRTCGDW